MGEWLTILPSTVNGMELSAEEFHDTFTIHYSELST
jgi:hypothetical protein